MPDIRAAALIRSVSVCRHTGTLPDVFNIHKASSLPLYIEARHSDTGTLLIYGGSLLRHIPAECGVAAGRNILGRERSALCAMFPSVLRPASDTERSSYTHSYLSLDFYFIFNA